MTTCLYRCSTSISSRRLYPTARRWNRNADQERVSFFTPPYQCHSTAAWFTVPNDAIAFSTARSLAYESMQQAEAPASSRSSMEVALASALAFAATASMMYAYPSEPIPQHGGGDSGKGDGGVGGGGEGPYATMAFAAQSFDDDGDVAIEPQPKAKVATALPRANEKGNTKPYDISVRAIKGGRVTMEDEYFVAEGGRFVAVFDGHGGGGVSQFLKHHLYDSVCHHLKEKHWEENDAVQHPSLKQNNNTECASNEGNVTPSVFSHVAALKAAFAQIEETVLADGTLDYQGSTAVAVLLHESEEGHRTLLSANVGDSRAILSRKGRAVDLTRDHKPNEEREKARILAMGETIEWDRLSKVHRVRNLSLSRAIGDRYAKPVVSGEVEINHYPVVEDGDEFILLASDGLWDVMTSEDAVSFVHQRFENELSSENIAKDDIKNYKLVLRRNMAKFVAREAIRRGSCDNVCVIMVWLNNLDHAK